MRLFYRIMEFPSWMGPWKDVSLQGPFQIGPQIPDGEVSVGQSTLSLTVALPKQRQKASWHFLLIVEFTEILSEGKSHVLPLTLQLSSFCPAPHC